MLDTTPTPNPRPFRAGRRQSLSSIINGCNYQYQCLTCGVAIDDDRTGTRTSVHTQWHTTIQPLGAARVEIR